MNRCQKVLEEASVHRAKTTVHTQKMVHSLVADIMKLALKFFPSHSLVESKAQPCDTHFVDVKFVDTPQDIALHAYKLYQTSSLPKYTLEDGQVCFYLQTPEELTLQPGEWRSVHFGLIA